MKNLYCEKCNKNRPHQYIGREHDFDRNILGRVFVGIATLGFSEIICNNCFFYKCKCCGEIQSVDD